MKHIIDAREFDTKFLEELFSIADSLHGKRNKSLDGKILASIFYEPSTRTRMSFESAMYRLGGHVISMESAMATSSAAKGETIEDTMQMLNQYVDAAVIRHPETGTLARAASVAKIPLLNAGDGPGQHPTQALLDLYTIKREVGRTENVRLVGVGDMKNGRTIRSLCYLLALYPGVSVVFVSPPELKMGDDIKEYLKSKNVPFEETEDMESAIKNADVVYMTRIQKERFKDPEEYARLKGKYVLTRAHADSMKEGSIIMHPLPRVDEITTDVDSSPHALYFKQAGYGVTIRMALLKYLLG